MRSIPEVLSLLCSRALEDVVHAGTLAEALGMPAVLRLRELLGEKNRLASFTLTVVEARLRGWRSLRCEYPSGEHLAVLRQLHPNLEALDLSGQEAFEDLRLLHGLEIRVLDLTGCFAEPVDEYGQIDEHGERSGVRDVSPLAGLSALRTLSLRGCQCLDAETLKGLTQLEELDIRETRVDPAPVRHLTNLRRLRMDCHGVGLPLSLGELGSLEELTIDRPQQLEALVPVVSRMRALRRLDLGPLGIQEGVRLFALCAAREDRYEEVRALGVSAACEAALVAFQDAVEAQSKSGIFEALDVVEQLGEVAAVEWVVAQRLAPKTEERGPRSSRRPTPVHLPSSNMDVRERLAMLAVRCGGETSLDVSADVRPWGIRAFIDLGIEHMRLGAADVGFDTVTRFAHLRTLSVGGAPSRWRDYSLLAYLPHLRTLDLSAAGDVGQAWRQVLEDERLERFFELYATPDAREALGLSRDPPHAPGGDDSLL